MRRRRVLATLLISLVCVPIELLAALPPGQIGPEGRWTCRIQFRARPGQKPLTIAMAIQKVLAQNPSLLEARAAIGSAKGSRVTAALRPNPALTALSFNVNRDAGNQAYQLSQTFETGGKRHKRVRVANCGVSTATLELGNRERVLVGQTRQAFIKVLQMLSDTECADRTLRSYDEIAGRGMQPGKESEADLRVSNERIELENELERAVLAVEVAKHDLSELMGEPAIWAEYDVDGGMQYVDTRFRLDQLQKAAFENRPDWKAAAVQVDQAQAQLSLARAQRAWNVTAGPAVTHSDGNSALGVGFVVSTQPQIFDRNQGEIAKAQNDVVRAQENRRRVELAIERELRKAFDRYRVTQRIVQSYRNRYLRSSVLALNASTKAYQARKIAATDYLDALRTYRKIQINYRLALAEHMLALNDINLACAGEQIRLDPTLTLGNDAEDSLYFSPTYLSGGHEPGDKGRRPGSGSPAGPVSR